MRVSELVVAFDGKYRGLEADNRHPALPTIAGLAALAARDSCHSTAGTVGFVAARTLADGEALRGRQKRRFFAGRERKGAPTPTSQSSNHLDAGRNGARRRIGGIERPGVALELRRAVDPPNAWKPLVEAAHAHTGRAPSGAGERIRAAALWKATIASLEHGSVRGDSVDADGVVASVDPRLVDRS
jgi:hypothetical protein